MVTNDYDDDDDNDDDDDDNDGNDDILSEFEEYNSETKELNKN